jgi:hypothetical protein
MQRPGMQPWSVHCDVPYYVNFVFWVRRHAPDPPPFAEAAWDDWLTEVINHGAGPLPTLAGLASHPALRELALRYWKAFQQSWSRSYRDLAHRLTETCQQANLSELLEGKSVQCRLLFTTEPGDFRRQVGQVWVLGEDYLHPERLRSLVVNLTILSDT